MTHALFDSWTAKYDAWFDTPQGQHIKTYESNLLMELLAPNPGETILDAGCGTGIFTGQVLDCNATVTGVDISFPMIQRAAHRFSSPGFSSPENSSKFNAACCDMSTLPFADNQFDRVFSMTAIEFVEDAAAAVAELNRVAKKGGTVVVTTLNSLSPWADRRMKMAEQGHQLFRRIFFRSPEDMQALIPAEAVIKTAIHFSKHASASDIPSIEAQGKKNTADTGAFLAAKWIKV